MPQFSAGSAALSIVPDLSGFHSSMEAELAKINDKVSVPVQADTAAAQAALAGVQADLDRINGSKTTATVGVNDDGSAGRFAESLRARLEAAVSNLPAVRIDGDSTDADQKIAAIRAELTDLSNKTIGVDINSADAKAKLDELQAKLADISRSSADVQVKADTGAASAELTRFQAELDRINGQTATATVKVDEDGSLDRAKGNFGSLMSAALSLAPAIIPIGAAAIASGGAVAAMGAVGGGALATLGLAFSGVGDAVKLLDKQEAAQAQTSAASSASQVQHAQAVAAAQDQVKSAKMSLADAERNAASQRIAANQAVEQAEYGVQQAAQRVQEAQYALQQADEKEQVAVQNLASAREAATRGLQTAANTAVDAALAQKQSVLDLQTAQDNYNKVMASATSTEQQRQQASLDLAKAQQRVTEASEASTNATQDNNTAQKLGVEGSPQVVAAHKAVEDAQHGVATAAQALADAQHGQTMAIQNLADAQRKSADVQIQSNEAIVRAQDGVAKALAALAAANQDNGAKTSAALGQVNDALNKLDPATRQFAEYVRGTLQPALKDVQATAAAGLLPGVEAGLTSALQNLPAVKNLFSDFAVTLGGLARQAGASLGGPEWGQFFNLVAGQGIPIIRDFGTVSGNLALGFRGIIEAFLPMAGQLSSGLADLSGKFADFGKNLGSSSGFQTFTAYVQTAWPQIKGIIDNVATAIANVAKAGAPLGLGFLTDLRLVSSVLAALPVPVVQALAVAFAAVKLNSAISAPIEALSGVVGKMAEKFIDAGGAASSASQAVGNAAQAGSDAAGGFSDAASTAADMASGLSESDKVSGKLEKVLGGLGTALPILGVGVGLVTSAFEAQAANVQKATDELTGWYKEILTGGPGAQEAADKLNAYNQKVADTSAAYDKASKAAAGAASGNDGYAQGVAILGGNLDTLKKQQDDAKAAADRYIASLSPLEKAQVDATNAGAALNNAIRDFGPHSAQAAEAGRNYAATQAQVKTAQDQAAQATDGVSRALLNEQNIMLGIEDTSLGFRQAIQGVTDAHKASADALKQYGPASDEYKRAMLNEESAMRQAMDAAGKLTAARHADLDQAQQQALANAGQLQALNDLKAKYGQLPPELENVRKGLEGSVKQGDLAAVAFDNLGLKVQGVPDAKTINVSSTSPEVDKQLTALGFHVEHMPNGTVNVTANTKDSEDALAYLTRTRTATINTVVNGTRPDGSTYYDPQQTHAGAMGRASGGFITGPGTGTSDSIPAMLSHGEYVVRAASVDRYGIGFLDAVNAGHFALGGLAQGYAAGGLVSVPVGQPVQHFAAGGGVSANWGGTIDLAPGDISPLAQFWADALSNIATISGAARSYISGQFGGLRTDVDGHLAGLAGSAGATWGQVTTALKGGAASTRTSVVGEFGGLQTGVIGAITAATLGGTGAMNLLRDNVTGASTQAKLNSIAQTNQMRDGVTLGHTQTRDNGTTLYNQLRDNVTGASTQAKLNSITQTDLMRDGVTLGHTQTRDNATTLMGSLRDNVLGLFTQTKDNSTTQTNQMRDAVNLGHTQTRDNATTLMSSLRDNVLGLFIQTKDNSTTQTNQMRDGVTLGTNQTRDNGTTSFNQLRDNVTTTSSTTKDNTTRTFGDMATDVTRAFTTTVTNSGNAWNGIVPATAHPVNTVVNDVLNNGLFKAFNAVSTAVATPQIVSPIKFALGLFGLAAGGEVPGWSPHDKADNIPAMLTAGEFVQPVATVQKYGVDFMEAVRSGTFPEAEARRYATGGRVTGAANDTVPDPGSFVVGSDMARYTDNFLAALEARQTEAVQAAMFAKFARGGPVTDIDGPPLTHGAYVLPPDIASFAGDFLAALDAGSPGAILAAGGFGARGPEHFAAGGVVHAQDVARSMNGKPYIWGGASPAGADCSGYQSIVTNALRGAANPYFRVGSTANFPWAGFVNGFGSAYTIGSIKNAGGGIGHMASTLGGVNLESGGSHGNVAYGGPAVGADNRLFNIHAYLPEAGGVFASGGGGGGALVPQLLGGQWADTAAVLAYLRGSFKGANDALPTQFAPMRAQIQALQGVGPTELTRGWDGFLKAKVDAWFAAHPPIASGGTGEPGAIAAGPAQDQTRAVFKNYGWDTGAQWAGVDYIVSHESGWNPGAQNRTSTASGLFQMIDGTWASYRPGSASGIAHMKNAPVPAQAAAGAAYIKARYGDPVGAENFWKSHHFYADGGLVNPPALYDDGGWLPPGLTTVYNGTGRPESVRTAAQEQQLVTAANHHGDHRDRRRGGLMGDVHIHHERGDSNEIMDELWHRVRVAGRGGVYSTASVYAG